jgi:hypothetical protein
MATLEAVWIVLAVIAYQAVTYPYRLTVGLVAARRK